MPFGDVIYQDSFDHVYIIVCDGSNRAKVLNLPARDEAPPLIHSTCWQNETNGERHQRLFIPQTLQRQRLLTCR